MLAGRGGSDWWSESRRLTAAADSAPTREAFAKVLEKEVDDGGGVKSERLGYDEAADDGDSQRAA